MPKKPPRKIEVDPTNGGFREFKQGKLPWSQPSWLFLNAFIHLMTSIFELLVLGMTYYWGGYSQNKYFDATLQVDYDPDDIIVVDPGLWIEEASVDLCTFILCQTNTVSMAINRIRNITRTKSGIVLLQGIEQVSIRVKNPIVWGLPALSTQYRNMEIVFKNPTAEIYDVPYGRFTNGGAGTLVMTEGPLDELSPSSNFIVASTVIIFFAALFQTTFICYFDPDTATYPYPDGWEFEGLDDIEENGKRAALKAGAEGEDGMVALRRPPTDAELKYNATKAAKEREKIEKDAKEKKIKSKLRCRRGYYSCCCYPCVIITFVKTSLRDTRESFLLASTIIITTSLKTIPLTTMFVYLSFVTPRGMTDLIMLTIIFQCLSITLSIVLWERSALRTEQNLIVRLLHPAIVRMSFARILEITTNTFIFGLFTSQYGNQLSIPLLLIIDMLSIGIIMIITWKKQLYTLNNSKTSGYGVFRRYVLTLPILMVLHFDHIPGRSGERHTIINPRMYYLWRILRHIVLLIFILNGIAEMTNMVAAGWYAVGFTLSIVSAGGMMPMVNTAMLAWQDLLELPCVGLKIPLPKQCRRDIANEENNNDNNTDDGNNTSSTRTTLMELYGAKASDMEEEGKKRKDELRRYEKERKERHERGEYSDDENEIDDKERNDDHHHHKSQKQSKEPYVFEGINLDKVENLMEILLKETESKCQGCEGLTTAHDDNCKLEEINNRKKKKKSKKRSKYRFEMPEEPPEIRGSSYRKHVMLSPQAESLSFEARRIQRLQGKSIDKDISPTVKHGVSLSQQAASLHKIGGGLF